MENLFVGIVTPTGIPRNPNLISNLEFFSEAITLQGVFGEDLTNLELRSLSSAEIGCKYSHAEMYRLAKNFNWALIVEDDAELNMKLLCELENRIDSLETNKPLVISCYLGKWSVLKNRSSLEFGYKALTPPDGTICYFINKAAMQLANKEFEYIRPADWPIWSRKVEFVVVPDIAREYELSISMIDPSENRIRDKKSLGIIVREFLGLNYWGYFGFNLRAVKEIWFWIYRQRIIWYFPFLFGGKRSIEFTKDILQ